MGDHGGAGRKLWPVERSHAAAGEKREGEGAAERSCCGLTTVPTRCTARLKEKEVEESGLTSEAEPGENGGVRGGRHLIYLCFSAYELFHLTINLIFAKSQFCL